MGGTVNFQPQNNPEPYLKSIADAIKLAAGGKEKDKTSGADKGYGASGIPVQIRDSMPISVASPMFMKTAAATAPMQIQMTTTTTSNPMHSAQAGSSGSAV